MAPAEVTDGGVAFRPDHSCGLLPELAGNGTEGVLLGIMTLDIPPTGGLAVVAPEALDPFTRERQDAIEGSQKLIGFALA